MEVPARSNSEPEILWIELPRETVEFMVRNSEFNLEVSLKIMSGGMTSDRATLEKLVDMNTYYKIMMEEGRKAIKPNG